MSNKDTQKDSIDVVLKSLNIILSRTASELSKMTDEEEIKTLYKHYRIVDEWVRELEGRPLNRNWM